MWEIAAPDMNRGFNARDSFPDGDFGGVGGDFTFPRCAFQGQEGVLLVEILREFQCSQHRLENRI
jgi:hypothetical protein